MGSAVDQLVADLLAVNLARVRAQAARAQLVLVAPPLTQAAAKREAKLKKERKHKPPRRPPSEPQHAVTTLLTRSELMALERMAREAGITPEEMLRWCLQAYSEEFDAKRAR